MPAKEEEKRLLVFADEMERAEEAAKMLRWQGNERSSVRTNSSGRKHSTNNNNNINRRNSSKRGGVVKFKRVVVLYI